MATKQKLLTPVTPGEILAEEFLEPEGLSLTRLARELDVPTGRLSQIVNGKRAITADTALRLERYFGVSAQFWLNLQSRYDLKVARRKTWPAIELRVRSRNLAQATS